MASGAETEFVFTGDEEVPKDVTKVVFHSSVTEVSCEWIPDVGYNGGFLECTRLKEVVLNDGLLKIGQSVFLGCSSLEHITFPSSVVEVGDSSFNRCVRLKKVVLNEGLVSIGRDAFGNCKSLENIEFPSTLFSIGTNAFALSNLKEVVCNEGLTYIHSTAFAHCRALKRVKFPPSSLSRIEDATFVGCESLKSITLPSRITEIGDGAFASCPELKEVVIHLRLEKIHECAFQYCNSLQSFTLPNILKRLKNINQNGNAEVVRSITEHPDLEIRGDDILISHKGVTGRDPNFSNGGQVVRRLPQQIGENQMWGVTKKNIHKVLDSITYYELKEATTIFELALWKARIDEMEEVSLTSGKKPSEEDGAIDREACRVYVPGPVMDAVLQYFDYARGPPELVICPEDEFDY